MQLIVNLCNYNCNWVNVIDVIFSQEDAHD